MCPLLAVWLWVNHSLSLGFHFPLHPKGVSSDPLTEQREARIYWDWLQLLGGSKTEVAAPGDKIISGP